MQVALEAGGLPGKALLLVADVPHRLADLVLEPVDDALRPAHFPGQDDAVGCDHGLAGHARDRVGGQERVNHGVGNPVGDLVGMAFGDAFAGEQIAGALSDHRGGVLGG